MQKILCNGSQVRPIEEPQTGVPTKIKSKIDEYKHTNEFLDLQNRKINKLREKKIILGHLMRITKS